MTSTDSNYHLINRLQRIIDYVDDLLDRTSTNSNDDSINQLQEIFSHFDDLFDETSSDSNSDLISQWQEVKDFINFLLNEMLTDSDDDLINEVQTVLGYFNSLFDDTSTDGSDTDTIQPSQDDAPSKMKLIIHNQFPGIELTFPVYAGRHVTCHSLPDQSINVDSTIQVDFNINTTQYMPTGVLMYKLQRKATDQSNEDVTSSENEATCIQLIIIWKINSFKEFFTASYLLEHKKDYFWDRNELLRLNEHYKLTNIQHGIIENTWLMHDNTVLMTSLNVTHEEEYYKLKMTISEESVKDDTQRPRYIDVDRWVSMMMMLIIMFAIHANT
jgi:hypothetical protein